MKKEEIYQDLIRKVISVLEGEVDPITWMSTLSCLIRESTGNFWVGFYRVKGQRLEIGPYQGTLGCLHISFGKGVCGACAERRQTILVPDVHKFPGHIACDSRSNSEIVVPVFDNSQKLQAVLDIDSIKFSNFDQIDQKYLEQITAMMTELEWNS